MPLIKGSQNFIVSKPRSKDSVCKVASRNSTGSFSKKDPKLSQVQTHQKCMNFVKLHETYLNSEPPLFLRCLYSRHSITENMRSKEYRTSGVWTECKEDVVFCDYTSTNRLYVFSRLPWFHRVSTYRQFIRSLVTLCSERTGVSPITFCSRALTLSGRCQSLSNMPHESVFFLRHNQSPLGAGTLKQKLQHVFWFSHVCLAFGPLGWAASLKNMSHQARSGGVSSLNSLLYLQTLFWCWMAPRSAQEIKLIS